MILCQSAALQQLLTFYIHLMADLKAPSQI